MELNLFKNICNEIKKVDITNFINELSERLNKMEEELVIDRFEANVAICENRKTGEIKQIDRNNIPKDINEGDCIKFVDGKYIHDKARQEEIEKRIKEKMDNLWED